MASWKQTTHQQYHYCERVIATTMLSVRRRDAVWSLCRWRRGGASGAVRADATLFGRRRRPLRRRRQQQQQQEQQHTTETTTRYLDPSSVLDGWRMKILSVGLLARLPTECCSSFLLCDRCVGDSERRLTDARPPRRAPSFDCRRFRGTGHGTHASSRRFTWTGAEWGQQLGSTYSH